MASAAIVVKRLLESRGVGGLPPALNLIEALLRKHRKPTKIDLRNREANLGDDLLVNLVRDFGDLYLRLFQGPFRVDSGQISRAPDPERDWPVILEAQLRLSGPGAIFPGTAQLVQGVLTAGAGSRKARQGPKPAPKDDLSRL